MRKKDILNKIKTEKEVTKAEQPQAGLKLENAQSGQAKTEGNTKPLTLIEGSSITNPGQSVAQSQVQPKPLSQAELREVVKNAGKPEGQAQTEVRPAPRPEGKAEQVEQKPQQKPEKKQDKKWQTRPQAQPQDTLKGFVGKDVVLTLRGGSKLQGRLESVAQFDIVITASYKPIIVLKHAVDYVELAESLK